MRNRILGVVCSIGVMSCHSAYAATKFEVTAETFAKGQLSELNVLNGFGCTGKNISPKITWRGEPEGTQSYVVSMYDPDAPTGSGWWHWVIANIPASVHEIPKGAGSGQTDAKIPEGTIQTNTDFGQSGYGGPCPPEGTTHRYIITVTALKVPKLDVTNATTGAQVGFMAGMNSLGKATYTLTYGR